MQRTKWALGFVMLVFGFLIMTQLRVHQASYTDPSGLRADELARELKATQEKLKAAEKENAQLKAEVDKVVKAGGSGVVPVPQRNPNLELLAGVGEAKGPGIMVNVVEAAEVANKTRVRDEDLWMITNELLAAGAEGVAINGQRITAVSGIRNVGNRIMVNQAMTTSPFQIAAIGDSAVLETALRLRNGVVDTLGRWGLKVTIARSDSIRLPSFGTPPDFRHIKLAQ